MLTLLSRSPLLVALLLAVCAVEAALVWMLSPAVALYGRAGELDADRPTLPEDP